MNRSEFMTRQWSDPAFKSKMRQARWGTHKNRSDDDRRRYMRDQALVRKFGITREKFNELLAEQGGVCAVCRQTCKSGRALAVDHNHVTGAIRGLLCADCNRALGMLNDDPELLIQAAEYLL